MRLTRIDATHWTMTLTGKESTQIEYKYTLGDWDHVEKDGGCGEISNRQLTLELRRPAHRRSTTRSRTGGTSRPAATESRNVGLI